MQGKQTPIAGVPVPQGALRRKQAPAGRAERAVSEALTTLARWSRFSPSLTIEDMRAHIREIVRGVDRDLAIKLETVVHTIMELKEARADLAEVNQSRDRLRELLRERLNALALQTRITRSANKLSSPGVEVAAQWKPCSGVSGDWWAAYQLRDGRVVLVLGDALGHGASAALLSGIARGACDLIMRRVDPRQIQAGVILAELNAALRDTGASQTEMTCAVAILDPASGELSVASAGHPLPLLLPATEGAMSSLGSVGPGLGAEDDPHYDCAGAALHRGDVFVLFSDGLLDCGEGRSSFGVRRLRQALESLRDDPPATVRDQLWLRLKSARGAAPLADDITYVIARYLGAPPA